MSGLVEGLSIANGKTNTTIQATTYDNDIDNHDNAARRATFNAGHLDAQDLRRRHPQTRLLSCDKGYLAEYLANFADRVESGKFSVVSPRGCGSSFCLQAKPCWLKLVNKSRSYGEVATCIYTFRCVHNSFA